MDFLVFKCLHKKHLNTQFKGEDKGGRFIAVASLDNKKKWNEK